MSRALYARPLHAKGGSMKAFIPAVSFLCLALAVPVSADVHYVDINSIAPTSPYTNAATAATNIQDAVDVSTSGDTVLVSDGHYILSAQVSITNAIMLLSADGPDQALIDGNGSVRCLYLDDNASVVSGFTIANGGVTGGDLDGHGGGVYCIDTTPVLTNCTLTGNSAAGRGGGVIAGTLYDCRLIDNVADEAGGAQSSTLYDCQITGNTANFAGGMARCTGYDCMISNNTVTAMGSVGGAYKSTLTDCTVAANYSALSSGGVLGGVLTNCTIIGNSAAFGGGGATDADLYNCSIIGNSAGSDAGGADEGTLHGCLISGNSAGGSGGGTYWNTLYNCTIVGNSAESLGGGAAACAVYGCVITGNTAADRGGGVHGCTVYDSTISNNTAVTSGGGTSYCELERCVIAGNSADAGGGGVSAGTATNCTIIGNSARVGGGGASFADLYRCSIISNSSLDEGGGVDSGYLYGCLVAGNEAATYGGGVYHAPTRNCTVVDNTADQGGGVWGASHHNNAIIVANHAVTAYDNWDYPSNIFSSCTTPLPAGTGCITNDPQFIDAANGNYRLQLTSPCIDAGDNDEAWEDRDRDGNPRIAGGAVDMGAYERQANLYVDLNSTTPVEPYSTWGMAAAGIQDALDVAADGQTVWVTNGHYILSANVLVTNAIAVRSANGPDVTIVDGDGAVRCFNVTTSACTISGFTIAGGSTPGKGAAVSCADATTVITNCILSGNAAAQSGGAAYRGTVSHCVLTENEAGAGGATDTSTLDNCLVVSNRADHGGGATGSTLYNCTVVSNHAAVSGGGIYGGGACNTIVYHNTAPAGDNYWQSPGMTNCCTTPLPPGDGCIDDDPEFVDPDLEDYRLSEGSVCINAGTNAYVQSAVDLDGQVRIAEGTVDIGSYERTPYHYVVTSNPGAAWPYATWATAATNIQDAVDAAFPLDTVVLTNGQWEIPSTITVDKPVTIRGLNGPEKTWVRGPYYPRDRCFLLADVTCTLSGLLIRSGETTGDGAGVHCAGRTPLIEDCWIRFNLADGDGGGVSGGTLQRCLVERNWGANGAGVADSAVYNSVMYSNTASVAGGAAYDSELVNCTLIENTADGEGGGIYDGTAANCIIYTNTPDNWYAATPAVTYSCTTPLPPGAGCIDDPPRLRLVKRWWDSRGLQPDSPCFDAGSDDAVQGDTAFWGIPRIIGERVDMGAHEYNPFRYVAISNETPAYPYQSWATAATNIHDAVNLAEPQEIVLVTNGHYVLSSIVDVMEPITIRGVNGPDVTYVDGNGTEGCFYLYGGRACTLSGFTITNGYRSSHGGGVWCGDDTPVITNCLITGNRTLLEGGGVYWGTLRGCTLSGNSARDYGGGASLSLLRDCVITGNTAEGGGGASSASLIDCSVTDNTADLGGGAMWSALTNCVVSGNSATDGGGGHTVTLVTCIVSNNSSVQYGGGARDSELDSCLLVDNSAGLNGGGTRGGVLRNCTLTANHADGHGGGTYGGIVLNTIVYDNTAVGSDPNWSDSTPRITNVCTTPLPPGPGCMTDDPQFRDPSAGDYSIGRGTPCVGAGSNLFVQGDMDLAGNDRIIDGTVDIGAYEYNPYHYVALDSAAPLAPYGNWRTAARVIHDAVDVCDEYEAVIVSNGVHVLTNEVVMPDLITVRSLNGRDVTTLDGNGETRCFSVGYSACTIRGFTMRNGQAFRGGAVFGTGGNASVRDCAFVGNESTGGGDGGAVHAIGVVSNCTFTANDASGNGGGVNSCRPVIDCVFSGNTAREGGAASGSELYRCTLIGNAAETHGGGTSGGTLNNCLIVANEAGSHGGGTKYGTLINCTVVDNSSQHSGGGVYFPTAADNCIVYGNHTGSDGNNWYDTSPDLLYTCTIPLPPGEGCITNAPQFIYAAAANYRLKAGSPCINTGSNALAQGTHDLDGNDRILYTAVDMGAYEYYDALYDSDGDGLVDGDETGIYGTSPTNVNTDGDLHDDYEEMVALTDGADSNDYFRILDITGGPTVDVWFASSSNRLYSLYARGALGSGQWSSVSGQVDVVGEEGLDALSDAPATSRFYRITVALP